MPRHCHNAQSWQANMNKSWKLSILRHPTVPRWTVHEHAVPEAGDRYAVSVVAAQEASSRTHGI